MAKAEPDVEVEETPVVQPVKSRSRLIILLAVSVLVLFQAIFLGLILRSLTPAMPDDTREVLPDVPGGLVVEEPLAIKPGDLVEKPITPPFQSQVTSEDGTTGYMVAAQFTVMCEKGKESKYDTLYSLVKDKIRAEVLTILRNSKVEDIVDPNCTTIRNRILQKVNEILAEPQPIIKDVIAVDFRYTPA